MILFNRSEDEIGGGVGGILLLIGVGVLIYYCCRRRRLPVVHTAVAQPQGTTVTVVQTREYNLSCDNNVINVKKNCNKKKKKKK